MTGLRFENVEHLWLWLAGIIVGAGILAVTYWAIVQRSQRAIGWGLMALRAAGLLALFLMLAKPTWTRESEQVDPGRVAIIVDNSLSMTLADPSGKTRYALAREAVEQIRQSLRSERSPRTALDLFDITGQPRQDQLPEQASAERTDLAQAINTTTRQLRSRLLTSVVLISDGMDNTGRQDFRDLGDAQAPIYTVGFRADPATATFDLAVKRVQAPERAMVHNTVKIDIVVAKTGGAPIDATITIKRGKEPFVTEKIAFGAGDEEKQVSLNLTPHAAGRFVFTAAITAAAGERNLANNARHFPLRVEAEPVRVLYREGFLRYEYKYLKARLEDDPDIALDVAVRAAAPDASAPRGDAISAERLKNIDVVILGDMEASYLTPSEYQALLHWLDEKNHGLVVLGGYHAFGAEGFRKTPLADALPVAFAEREPSQSEEPFVLQLTEAGQRHPLFTLTGDLAKDSAAWSAAPQLLGSCLVAKAKPAAEVLAVNSNIKVDGQPAVVIAVQRFGGGHTMVLTADTTWRWSRMTRLLGQTDTLYARFWSQTLRWLAGRGKDAERPLLALSTDRPDYAIGRAVAIRALRQPRPDADLSKAELSVEVTSPAGKSTTVPMRSSSAEPDAFTGVFYPTAGGRHEIAAALLADGKPLANQAAEFLVQGPDLELADTGTSPANLQAIANATGGRYFDISEVDKLTEQLPRRERRTPRVERIEYWNSPWLFLIFLAAVTSEWVLRRRNHMV